MLSEYIFLPGVDQFNKDIKKITLSEPEKKYNIFNSLGYVKGEISYLEKISFFKKDEGLFIKKDRCDIILDRLDNCPSYIHLDNKDEVKEFIQKISFDGPDGKTVIFTNSNSWYINTLVKNLLKSYDLLNKNLEIKEYPQIGIFCSDNSGFEEGIKNGFLCCPVKCSQLGIENTESCKTPEEYRRLSFIKIILLDYLLSLGYTVLYIDPDMCFIPTCKKNVINELLNRNNSLCYKFGEDESIEELFDYSVKKDFTTCGYLYTRNDGKTSIYMNSNLMLITPSYYNRFLFKLNKEKFENICKNDAYGGDETYLNRFRKDERHHSYWSEYLFPNGNGSLKYKDKSLMLHANMVKGLQNKIALLKKCNGWFL